MTIPVALDSPPEPPPTLRRVCAWCGPSADRDDTTVTHFICEPCAAAVLADDVDDREELSGSTCGTNCGYCGRCS